MSRCKERVRIRPCVFVEMQLKPDDDRLQAIFIIVDKCMSNNINIC